MKILVAAGFEAASQKARVINTIKMAQGFARLGHEVTVVCRQPSVGPVKLEELATIYGLTEPLDWVQIPRRILGLEIDKYWRAYLALLVIFRRKPDLVYARYSALPRLSCKFGFLTVAESHAAVGYQSRPFQWLVKATCHPAFLQWVTISHRLAKYYYEQGVPKNKVIVLPDAVDLELFQRPANLPPTPYSGHQINITYTGHLYDYKGIPTILESAALLPEFHFHLVGGLEEDIKRQKQRAKQLRLDNVTFHGLKPQVEVPAFLWHADILLLPPSKYHPSAAWTSPVKLAEYLASGTPVIATDILALRDWLSEQEVEFVAPDDPQSLANGIRRLLQDPQRVEQLRRAGLQKAQTLTYKKRAEAILNRSKLFEDVC